MEENIKTVRYLEHLKETGVTNPNHAKCINTKDLFYKAQNGDDEAFNQIYLQNEYLIDEALYKHQKFIDTKVDIQVYKDRLTDCLIASILRFDPKQLIAFRAYATLNMYKILKHYLSSNPAIKRSINTPLSDFNEISSSEEHLYMYKTEDNQLLDDISYLSYLESKTTDDAKNLWLKVSELLNDHEHDLFYRHYVLNQTLDVIAEDYNTTKAVISYYLVNAKTRVKREIERANHTHMEIYHNGKQPRDLLQYLNTRQLGKVNYYLELHDYLYNNGRKPIASHTHGYLMYTSKEFRKNKYPPA
ncbi:MAG: sigma-70 family RNA polymerase sigma factor [Clostridiales bacterium]|nr:sigma-70 family RNA polymerase sigma factor [Clostridiales bacterium]